jgi:hypothetical protein
MPSMQAGVKNKSIALLKEERRQLLDTYQRVDWEVGARRRWPSVPLDRLPPLCEGGGGGGGWAARHLPARGLGGECTEGPFRRWGSV